METLKRRHYYQRDAIKNHHDTYEREEPLYDKLQKSSNNQLLLFLSSNKHIIMTILLTIVSFGTRCYAIDKADKVIWDEAHFGKFGSYYLKRAFYFDVHPPLGKMLIGLSGMVAGYNGSFDFDSQVPYPAEVDFVTMRIFCAAWGALMVPVAYGTAYYLNMSAKACFLSAAMVLFDTAILTISRFILLDSMLMFFTCLSFFCLAGFRSHKREPFSGKWWLWIASTGVSLGCVLSVKWVGLFAVALVGIYTVEELWDYLGDLEMPKTTYAMHWMARTLCLILLPVAIYIASFALHFKILTNSGPGDNTMSSLFQASLSGNYFENNPLDITYGSNITIRNYAHAGGLLHSHINLYPEGSKQQQVTCYAHKDSNNNWQLRKPRVMVNGEATTESVDLDNLEYIKDGDIVRIYHQLTGRNLHSHVIRAPISTKHWEVSCYGDETIGDTQDNWIVEIIKDKIKSDTKQLHALTTRFRLKNVHMNCYLASHSKLLPQWGFRQNEVYCDRYSDGSSPNTWWNIEEHHNEKLPPASKGSYKSSFFDDFKNLNAVMWHSNNALVADPDKKDAITSTPTQWPMLSVGLRMCGWEPDNVKFYLLGNPVVWWPSFISLFVFIGTILVQMVRQKRNVKSMSLDTWNDFVSVGKLFLIGWFLHYAPFFMMGRVTYLHHYFPALYFSVFMVPFLIDHFLQSPKMKNGVYAIMLGLLVANFIHFSVFSYGMTGDVSQYASREWFKHWDFTSPRLP